MKLRVALLLSLLMTVLNTLPAEASGIFTLRGKIKGFTEDRYLIETSTTIYEIRKSDMHPDQLAELRNAKTGQQVELVTTTESIVRARTK